jgi:voltage-dependent calcium channel
MYGLTNMIIFLILLNFLAALIGVQLLRGDIPNTTFVSFGNLYNSFLGMYQVFTSENWSTLLYNSLTLGPPLGRTVVTAVFLCSWLVFANCKSCHFHLFPLSFTFSRVIILQMFIAVINENFDVAEELKKGKQATRYWATHLKLQENQFSWLRKLNPYRWFKANPIKVKVDHLPSNLVLPIRKALIQDYRGPHMDTSSAPVSN